MSQQSLALNGLKVTLDKLEYNYGSFGTPDETPHIFVYYLTISNHSDRRVKLLGRKWIIYKPDLDKMVIEGDKIVGKEPDLVPGQSFSYNSFHVSATDASAMGSFHGVDDDGMRVHVQIPRFSMRIPEQSS